MVARKKPGSDENLDQEVIPSLSIFNGLMDHLKKNHTFHSVVGMFMRDNQNAHIDAYLESYLKRFSELKIFETSDLQITSVMAVMGAVNILSNNPGFSQILDLFKKYANEQMRKASLLGSLPIFYLRYTRVG